MDFETPSRIKPELNLAPLIDVVFLLLIFFMLTSTMSQNKAIDLTLPTSSSATPIDQKLINISLNSTGSFFWEETEISKDKLKLKLSELFTNNPDEKVILNVEKSVSAQSMIEALDVLRNSGGSNISIATKTNGNQ